ncbi:hypothetical protein ACFOTA_06705 [Chitinophaga sp. GCM10012297]|uniref:DNA-binding protein n=1 Tax=Chitinophaga chungangae TaxID=2821488 RepID=A0ABS3YB38_9BACT|nr:hypothetical protein [Chitinophaga chungangae]MBO9151890.1 hypothetical protein [Chitinophaga chungangae]
MKESTTLAREIAKQLIAIADLPHCEWISEKKAVEEFPFSLDMLRDMRGAGTLEFNYHWKHIRKAGESRKKPGIIYHRQRMIKFIEDI